MNTPRTLIQQLSLGTVSTRKTRSAATPSSAPKASTTSKAAAPPSSSSSSSRKRGAEKPDIPTGAKKTATPRGIISALIANSIALEPTPRPAPSAVSPFFGGAPDDDIMDEHTESPPKRARVAQNPATVDYSLIDEMINFVRSNTPSHISLAAKPPRPGFTANARTAAVIGGPAKANANEKRSRPAAIPPSMVKATFSKFSTKPLDAAALAELSAVVSEFLGLCGSAVADYADHAGRTTINRTDIELLLHRMRLVDVFAGERGRNAFQGSADAFIRGLLPQEFVDEAVPVARAKRKE